MLSAEQIFKADDTGELVKVDVPEWGGSVYVGILSGTDRDRWELNAADSIDKKSTANIRALLCVYAIRDDKNKRIFTDNQAAQLGQKSGIALDRVFAVAKRVNKISDDDIEEIEKN